MKKTRAMEEMCRAAGRVSDPRAKTEILKCVIELARQEAASVGCSLMLVGDSDSKELLGVVAVHP